MKDIKEMPLPQILPPLINSANPWATTVEDLQALFDCPHTGAVTTRTSLLDGFNHDPAVHQHIFFNPQDHSLQHSDAVDGSITGEYSGSLNTLGYSPVPLHAYLSMIPEIVARSSLDPNVKARKPFIVSVTGSVEAVRQCHREIVAAQAHLTIPLCMEINLSCPNIPDKPPPAYSRAALMEYLVVLGQAKEEEKRSIGARPVMIGIKTPPYTYQDQFTTLVAALLASCTPTCPINFITATNTLGSSLVMSDFDGTPALSSVSGEGIGGMAGAPLHPLALGNVKLIRAMLNQHEPLKNIDVIGVGGVGDNSGYRRMRTVGARVVGIGTALGREGVGIFEKILPGESFKV